MLYAILCWVLDHSKILNTIYWALRGEETYKEITWEDDEAYERFKN